MSRPISRGAEARPYYLGLDGCRGGWAAARLEGSVLQLSVVSSLDAMREELLRAEKTFIDIPIGLPEKGAAERVCDAAARKALVSRKASVFRVPVRSAVYAPDYRSALDLQRRHTGSGISIQSWNIAAKIRETDEFLRAVKPRGKNVYESHPELCFAALNRGPLLHAKKTAEGVEERLRLLSRKIRNAGEKIREALDALSRNRVRIDDLLDACVLALSARLGAQKGITSLPSEYPSDRRGLPMRIVYPAMRGAAR